MEFLQHSPLFGGSALRLGAGLAFTAMLATACVTDVRSRRIPNWLVVVLALSGSVFSAMIVPGWGGVTRSVLVLLLGFGIWVGFFVLGALGAGDVKLFAAAGAWLGPSDTWRAALLAAVVGGALAVVMLVWQRRLRASFRKIALAASVRSITPLGTADSEGDTDRRRHLPYGVALAVGALLAAWVPRLVG